MGGSLPGAGYSKGSGTAESLALQQGGTPAVTGADGKLTAFDPAAMAGTAAPASSAIGGGGGFDAAGVNAQGIPDYMANWLASGGTGEAPTVGGPATVTVDPATALQGSNRDPYRPPIHPGKGFSRWPARQAYLKKLQGPQQAAGFAGGIQPTYSGGGTGAPPGMQAAVPPPVGSPAYNLMLKQLGLG